MSYTKKPEWKVEAGGVDITSDIFRGSVHRPENAISRGHIWANDYEGKNFIANLDAFTIIRIAFRYEGDAWDQVFEGVVEKVGPKISDQGLMVEAVAYGYGRALRNTHNNTSYGMESWQPTIDTPKEICEEMIDEMVNKSFGGAASGYGITKNKIGNINIPQINFMEGRYRNNLAILNDTLKIYQAYRNGLAGLHWFVDVDENLFVNTIGNHEHNLLGWPTYWKGSLQTLTQGTDFISYFFHKKTNNFANKILLYADLRKPGFESWTEGNAANWGNDVANPMTNINDNAVDFVVGSESLEFDVDNAEATGLAFWPATADADWDFTKIGSEISIPTVNFYFQKDDDLNEASTSIRLFTTDINTDYFYNVFSTWTDPDDEWLHRSLPIGPYWKTKDEDRRYRWIKGTGVVAAPGGNAVWNDIQGIGFRVTPTLPNDTEFDLDDLHFAGKIIREAFNSNSIIAFDEVQKVIRYDAALDDTMDESDASGMAGLMAYNELLTAQAIPVTGIVTTPLLLDPLPGQLVHIHADTYSGGYRVNDTFRIKEIIHMVSPEGMFTTWDLTDDLLHSFGLGFNDVFTAFQRAMKSDPEMKNLKTTGLDQTVPRLSIDYP